ncbi:MAG: IPT/TIG domain-containing protein [Chloroflexota bacterium]
MKYIRMFRTVAVALVLALLVATAPAMPALAESEVYVSPSSGPVGTVITIAGSGFTRNASVSIYFPDKNTHKLYAETDITGYFSGANFSIAAYPVGSQTVYVRDMYSGNWSLATFTITSKISLDRLSGYVGDIVKVSGNGFADSVGATIYFDEVRIGTTTTTGAGTLTTSTATFTVPVTYQGNHTIKVIDASGNSDTTEFVVNPSSNISPTSGIVGSIVSVNGTAFTANHLIAITFDGKAVTTTQASVTTDSKGSFQVGFNVPVGANGVHRVTISDGTNETRNNFTILASADIKPISGYVGSKIMASGTGFLANKLVTINFDNEKVATASTDSLGSFAATFSVPVANAGKYKVMASDGTNIVEAEFSITTTASIIPVTSVASPGYVGTDITVNGVGFMAGKTATVTYSDNQVATPTVSADGSFAVSFKAPPSAGGEHQIIATDGISTREFTFIMESTPPAIPRPVKPEMDIKAKSETYFDWEDVTDPSGVTYVFQVADDKGFLGGSILLEKTGLIASEYTLTKEEELKPTSKEAPYYWHVKVLDGASNSSEWSGTGSFYVGGFLQTQVLIYVLLGIGALLLGVLGFWIGKRTSRS